MSDTRPSSLGDRIEQVCQAHNLNDRSWSLKAGLSEGYLATQRTRAADDPSFVLPEKSARKLAAVAKINVDWLRFGQGAMEGAHETAEASPRQALIDALARSVSELTAAGDIEGARIAASSLAKLLGVEPEVATSPSATTSTTPKRAVG
jgi:hypothetical protein